jgi:thermitase
MYWETIMNQVRGDQNQSQKDCQSKRSKSNTRVSHLLTLCVVGVILSSCGSTSISDQATALTDTTRVAPTRFDKILTVTITSSDLRSSTEKLYGAKIITWHPESNFATLGINTIAANALKASTKIIALETNKNSIRSPETAKNAAALGTATWSSGWSSWGAGWSTWGSGAGSSLTPTENQAIWGKIRLPQARAMATNAGAGIKIAIVDTGIDLQHPAFQNRMVAASDMFDWVDGDSTPQDISDGTNEAYGHGTSVAGIALQIAENSKIMPLRVLDSSGYGDVSNVAAAIDWAVAHGAQVINLSLGADYLKSLDQTISSATSKGVFVIAASGNSGDNNVNFPASASEGMTSTAGMRIGVGSVGLSDVKSVFSTYGSNLEMVAVGELVYGPAPSNQLAAWSGTSMATPMVSGGLALALGQRNYGVLIKNLGVDLVNSADNIDAKNLTLPPGFLGTGRLNLERFMQKTLAY